MDGKANSADIPTMALDKVYSHKCENFVFEKQ